jgi:uncharacterized cupin superfamily protein
MLNFKAGMASGVVMALLAITAFDAARFVLRARPVLPAPASQPLKEYAVDASWVSSGKPLFRTAETSRSADGRTISGLWSCEGPAIFEWRFDTDETLHVLEGEARVAYLGHQVTLRPGDVYTFHAGTRATWEVERYIKKSWTIHVPHAVGAWWRQLLRS